MNRAVIKSDAVNLLKHLEDGGKLGFGPLRPKVVKNGKYLLKATRVDGQLCDNPDSLRNLLEWIDIADRLDALSAHWAVHTDQPTGSFSAQVAEYHDLSEFLEKALALHEKVGQLREKIAAIPGLTEPAWHLPEEIRSLQGAIQAVLLLQKLLAIRKTIENLERQIRASELGPNPHPVVEQIRRAVNERDKKIYRQAYKLIQDLWKSRAELQRRRSLLEKLERSSPDLASKLVSSFEDPVWDGRIVNFTAAWNWSRADCWLRRLEDPDANERLIYELDTCRSHIRHLIAKLAEAKAWRHCFTRLTEAERQHLLAWTKAVRRIGKGKGKYASMHRKEARKHMDECRSAIPAWIMPIYRVAETIRPGTDAFDVVIIDEASQSGPEALFLYYLGKKIVVVGDDKQISPYSVGITRQDVELVRQRYIADIPHSDALGVDNSFFDQAEIRYGGRIRLREHFRCMPEIIQFSNNICYPTEPLIPMRQYGSDRLLPIIATSHVANGYQNGRSSRVVNPPEAQAIVEQIKECCEDPKYDGKTMGVISLLGQDQARLIERQLLNEIGPEEIEKRNLICGDSYAFQGDERDVIFLSLVSAPTEGQRIGTLSSQRDERRFNVAASRARDQMWLFHTATLNDLSTKCLRYSLLEYCFNPQVKPTALNGLDQQKLAEVARKADRTRMLPPPPFDSWFEVDVFLKIAERGYRVIPQFEIAGYFIDLVVEGMQGRLAIECDGDEWHGAERYAQDMERQRHLERCGLRFWRIRGSSFDRDPEAALSGLWETLELLEIYPGISKEPDETQESHTAEEESVLDIEVDEIKAVELSASSHAPEQNMSEEVTGLEEEQAILSPKTDIYDKLRQRDLFINRKDGVPKKSAVKKKTKEASVTELNKKQIFSEEAKQPISPRNRESVTQALIDLLPENERSCESCGETNEILIAPYGLFLKCTSPKCRKSKKLESQLLPVASMNNVEVSNQTDRIPQ
jgi:very-short-patch-repair endonuclease